jgi:hypothetical protein
MNIKTIFRFLLLTQTTTQSTNQPLKQLITGSEAQRFNTANTKFCPGTVLSQFQLTYFPKIHFNITLPSCSQFFKRFPHHSEHIFVSDHVLQPYIMTGKINVLYRNL